jgi:HEAT repeat protein
MTRRSSYYLILTVSVACTVLFIFGCGESPQIKISNDYPDTVFVDGIASEATQIIRDGLADENPRVRANAIEVVADTRAIKLMPKVQRLMKDDYVPVRFLAALAAGDLEYSLARREIGRLLEDEDESVRIAAAYAMAKFGSPDSLELVRKAISSDDQSVRANAALLLGKSGDRSVLKYLYWALRHRDSDDKVRFNAVEAIARLGDERIYPKLWAMLISTYHDDRFSGVVAMGTLGTVEAKNALITMLDDDVLEVRLVAAGELGMLGDNIGEAEVLDVFRRNLLAGGNKKDVERVKVLTALAIGQICTEPMREFVPLLLRDESEYVRIAAAKAVFQCKMKD